MSFPDQKTLKKQLESLDSAEGSLALPANPTPLEQFRFDLLGGQASK